MLVKNNLNKSLSLRLYTKKKNFNLNIILNQYNINLNEFNNIFKKKTSLYRKDVLLNIGLFISRDKSFEIMVKPLSWNFLINFIKGKKKIKLLDIWKIICLKKRELNSMQSYIKTIN